MRDRTPNPCRWRSLAIRVAGATVAGATVAGAIALDGRRLAVSATLASEAAATTYGAVASAHPLATAAGAVVLQNGGNAIDAAIATAFALSVVEPYSAGMGGGGFALTYEQRGPERIAALDFRERAPATADRDMYLDDRGEPLEDASRRGYLAAGVPGTVAGLAALHDRGGSTPWASLVAPAIALAERGIDVDPALASRIESAIDSLRADPAARKIFTRDGQPLQPRDRLVQRDLAATLRQVSRDPASFYRGPVADAIAQAMATGGGRITRTDLAQYQTKWRQPICGRIQRDRVCSMPPPSSGGVHLVQMLKVLDGLPRADLDPNGADYKHLLAEVMKQAYADRAEYLGDPDFVDVPVAALTSDRYADRRREQLDRRRARPAAEVRPGNLDALGPAPHESSDTTHLSVVDGASNAVSLTFTINGSFGARVVVPGTGIVLNNEMDDFAIAPGVPNMFGAVGGAANAIAPRKTPLSSMSPTLVIDDRDRTQLRLVLGSPGGTRIITTVLQTYLRHRIFGEPLERALAAPRIHHQWLPDTLFYETSDALSPAIAPAMLQDLERRGHALQGSQSWSNANAIAVDNNGQLSAATDPRGTGATAIVPIMEAPAAAGTHSWPSGMAP